MSSLSLSHNTFFVIYALVWSLTLNVNGMFEYHFCGESVVVFDLDSFFLFINEYRGKKNLTECNKTLRHTTVTLIISDGKTEIINRNAKQSDYNAGNKIFWCFQ